MNGSGSGGRRWLGIWFLGLALLGLYGYLIFGRGGFFANLFSFGVDAFLFFGLFLLWMAFYAQFVLPVDNWRDRLKIIDRLWSHLSRASGPAIFIENGRIRERPGESDNKQPGVLWLDSASAAVIRTAVAYQRPVGPGVHFTERGEYLAGVVDLHTQIHTLSLKEGDAPFAKLDEHATPEVRKKYEEARARWMAVRGLTRDGIEIIPNITVVFKIDAAPARRGLAGSHFGYDPDAVEKAIRGEGINASAATETARRVAWNQLPALIAADLWREYLSKFTLNQLFEAGQQPIPNVQPPEFTPFEPEPPAPPRPAPKGFLARLLHGTNARMQKRLDSIESARASAAPAPPEPLPVEAGPAAAAAQDQPPQTALQIIAQMVKARMTQPIVPVLDESGRLTEGLLPSDEYKKLKERGLAVLGVNVSNMRFAPAIENQIVQQWSGNWLANAKADQEQIERLNVFYDAEGRQEALREHALALSRALAKADPEDIRAAVRALLERTQATIKGDDRLHRRAGNEAEALEQILKWVETRES
jgi:hypothetical protein